ncbi:MAG: hypothetical protein IKM34_01835 [Clostridia bacterium]|nr:hypothetical protein [Clostridia bacterium]
MKVSDNKVAFFDGLYRTALEQQADLYRQLDKAYAQYRGSGDTDGGRPTETVRNITYELVESQISTDIPHPSVQAPDASYVKEKNAKRVEALLRSIRERLPFERLNDMDERYTYIYGGSVFLIEWDDLLTRFGEVGSVRVTGISPRNFVGQPGILQIDDMEYCFLAFDTTAEEICRRFSLTAAEKARLAAGFEENGTLSMVVCFYKNEAGLVSRFIWSGDVILSDIDDYYARKVKRCLKCLQDETVCTCGEDAQFSLVSEAYEISKETLLCSDGKEIPKGTRIRYYHPKHFPIVIRKNVSGESSCLGESDCLVIRPQQLEINKVLSRVHEKMMMSGVFPYKPDDCQFRYDNSVGGKVLNLRPGETASRFGVLDTTPNIEQDLSYLDALYKDAKRILGITDAFVGGDDLTTQSGKARQIQVDRSEGRLISKRVMKNAAYADMDRLIFELFLAYADEPRTLVYRDGYGKIESDAFCRYDFLAYDSLLDAYVYDDAYLFSVASEKPDKDEREALWKQNLTNYKEGCFGEVGKAEALAKYWQAQEYCGYPGAKDNRSYFAKELERWQMTD